MNSSNLQSDIYSWISSSPHRWFRYAGNILLHRAALTEELVDATLTIFCQDNGLEPLPDNADQYLLPAAHSLTSAPSTPIRLHKLRDVKGVNKLEEGHVIEFHKGLTVVFGINGSGKSGYVRVMKKAFKTHGDKAILPDVFADGPSIEPECTFEIGVDGPDPIEIKYPAEEGNAIFSRVTVFDTGSGSVHLDSESNLLFTPQGFDFFHIMSSLYQQLEQKLRERIGSKQPVQDFRARFGNVNQVQAAIFNLSSRSNTDELNSLGAFSQANSERLSAIVARQAEITSLNSNARLIELNSAHNMLRNLRSDAQAMEAITTTEFVETVNSTIRRCNELAELSTRESVSSFDGFAISLLGTTEWINFLRATNTYLLKVAEPNSQTIEEGNIDNCPLCLQPTGDTEMELFRRYWVYIKSEAQSQLAQATSSLDGIIQQITALNTSRLPNDPVAQEYLYANSPTLVSLMNDYVSKVQEYRTQILARLRSRTKVSAPSIQNYPSREFDAAIESVSAKIEALQISTLNQEMSNLNAEAALLRDMSQLQGILPQVLQQVEDLKWIDKANKLVGGFNTRPITDKGKALFNQYITDAYVSSFNNECTRLNAPAFVRIAERASRGNTLRKLSVQSYRPTEVLSEGEQRVIALAAFLTEAKLDPHNIAIVVDDPANSLDDARKECIAKRLVDESASRQVIVFTHDLPFLHSLYELSEENNRALHWVEPIGKVWANNSPLLEARFKTEKPAEDLYRRAITLPPQEKEMCVRHGFAALATCYEYLVEKVILHNSIQRFSKTIRFGNVRQIKIDEQLFDEIHTAYGAACDFKEGHLPADRMTSTPIEPKDLKDAIDLYKSLRDRQRAFSKSASGASGAS